MTVRSALCAAAALVLAGCATQLPPPGGPVDTTPPAILATTPSDGAQGVGRVSSVTVTFDENIDRGSLTTGAYLSPHVRIERWDWTEHTATAILADSLERDRTYTLVLSGGLTDRKGNRFGNTRTVRFATGAAMDSARILGTVSGRRTRGGSAWILADTTGALRAALADPARTGDAITELAPYLTLADPSGAFRLEGLRPGAYLVAAIVDRNTNRSWEPDRDLVAIACESTFASAGPESLAVRLSVGDPDERAVIRGSIVDSTAVPAGRDSAATDSLRRVLASAVRILVSGDTARVARVDSTLAFVVDSLGAGRVTLRAVRDDNGNGAVDPGEPASDPVAFCLGWADDRRNVVLRLVHRP